MNKRRQNVIGPICRKIREAKGMTQNQIAAKATICGFTLSRSAYANIETQIRKVSDYELVFLARALGVKPIELLPTRMPEWSKHITTGHFKE